MIGYHRHRLRDQLDCLVHVLPLVIRKQSGEVQRIGAFGPSGQHLLIHPARTIVFLLLMQTDTNSDRFFQTNLFFPLLGSRYFFVRSTRLHPRSNRRRTGARF